MKKIFLLAAVVCITGCGSSSPRFGASIAREKKPRAKTEAVRPSARTAKAPAALVRPKSRTAKAPAKHVQSKSRTAKAPAKPALRQSRPAAKKTATVPLVAEEMPTAMPPDEVSQERAESLTAVADTSAPVDQQKMMATIAEWLETPYSYGSDGNEEGIDCSAFTREVFEQAVAITLPRSSAEQAQVGEHVPRTELKFGDLVFFKTRGRAISHVGIYLGDNLFAHASSGSGVTISSLDSTYFTKRYATARRVSK